MFPVLAIGVGLALGWASGGSVQRLAEPSWRWGWLAILLFIAQGVSRGRLLGLAGWPQLGIAVWVCSSLCLVLILLLEWRVPGMILVGIGSLANVEVVLLNGGMPVGLPPLGTYEALHVLSGAQRVFYHPVAEHTLGSALGDVLPLGAAGSWTMVSAGDVLLIVGVCVWVVGTMTVNRPGLGQKK